MFQFVDRLWHFLFRSRFDESLEHLAGRLKFTQRLLLIVAAGFAFTVALAHDRIGALAGTIAYGASSVSPTEKLTLTKGQQVDLKGEVNEARPKLAAIARQFIGDRRPATNGFSWAVAQLISAAPTESASFKADYFAMLEADRDPTCNCYIYDGIPHTIALAWILISYAELGVEPPITMVDALLRSQDGSGWWSIAMDATPDDRNAGVPATAISVIAFQRLTARGMLPTSAPGRGGGSDRTGSDLAQCRSGRRLGRDRRLPLQQPTYGRPGLCDHGGHGALGFELARWV